MGVYWTKLQYFSIAGKAGCMDSSSLQDRFAPNLMCFGCGPANEQGLRIKSYTEDDRLVCRWTPQPHHMAFEGVLCGGIVGSLLDCHSNWCALWSLKQAREDAILPCTVTLEYAVQLTRPTPMDAEVFLTAQARSIEGKRVVVEAELQSGDKICATCKGTFVQVPEGHPAHISWLRSHE